MQEHQETFHKNLHFNFNSFITCKDTFLSRDFILAQYFVHLPMQVFGGSASILIEKWFLSADYVIKPQVFPQPSRRLPLIGKTAAH